MNPIKWFSQKDNKETSNKHVTLIPYKCGIYFRLADIKYDKKVVMEFDDTNHIILPPSEQEKYISSGNFNVRIIANGNEVIGKVVAFDCQKNRVVISRRLLNELKIDYNDPVDIFQSDEKSSKIKKIIAKIPKVLMDPDIILQYHLTHRSSLSVDDVITTRIFDKSYDIKIIKLFSLSGSEIPNGILYGSDSQTDIEIEFCL